MRLIGLTGYSRTGKDTLANAFVGVGYHKLSLADRIRAFYQPYCTGKASLEEVTEALRRLGVSSGEVIGKVFTKLPRGVVDVYTEVDAEKQKLRPLLEFGGEAIYPLILQAHLAEIDERLARGERVICSRVARPEEAKALKERGGVLFLVKKRDTLPATEWERLQVRTLIKEGYIERTLFNGEGEKEWCKQATEIANGHAGGLRA